MTRAGIVATTTNQTIRSSGVSMRLFRIERQSAARSARISCQKYATTAVVVPRCRATSNVRLKSSCVSRYVQFASQGSRMR